MDEFRAKIQNSFFPIVKIVKKMNLLQTMADENYKTLKSSSSSEYVVQRSRFFGYAISANTVEESRTFIKNISEKHPEANHCCWAYKTGFPDAPQQHYNDAGEPSGTAGRPISDAISQADLKNVVVVICRVFGGVKLGIRGLINAYHQSAKITLEKAEIIVCQPMILKEFEISYPVFEKLKRKVEAIDGKIESSEFSDSVKCTVKIPRSKTEELDSF